MWLGATPHSVAIVFSTGLLLKLMMLLLEASEKRKYLDEQFSQLPPEGIAGIINRSTFWWLNALFHSGFRNVLHPKDLYSLDSELSSARSRDRAKALRGFQPEKKHALFVVTAKSLLWPILRAVFPRLCLIGFTYAQPALISKIVEFAEQTQNHSNKNVGYGLIGATFLTYCGIALSSVHANHAFNRVLIMVRGTMIISIYEKMLQLSGDSTAQGSAVTLMSTDIDRICLVLEQVNELWAGTIEATVALILLGREVGYVAIAPLAWGIIAALLTSFISGKAPVRQQVWFKAIERRVAVTSIVLESMRGIKMMGLTPVVSNTVQEFRKREIDLSKGFRYFNICLNVLVSSQMILFPVLVFGVYTAVHTSKFTVSKASTTLSVVTLLSGPLVEILANIYLLSSAAACFDRIQNFLVMPILEDHRSLYSTSSRRPRTASGSEMPSNAAVIRNADIGSKADAACILKSIDLNIKAGSLTVITGPSGSGKSTLMQALLGENGFSNGAVEITSSTVAYCNDEPWLTNDTIAANITASKEFDTEWFASVLGACGFDAEMHSIINDESNIGSMGALLSGGQRQRVRSRRSNRGNGVKAAIWDSGAAEEDGMYSHFGDKYK
ncbi:MAG: hypothetical protein M1819_004854 [Sarea resinae]|nr:MAG: hypothetical protein M1819_004854 [Sarea resinae]